jgi:hypothetical protein
LILFPLRGPSVLFRPSFGLNSEQGVSVNETNENITVLTGTRRMSSNLTAIFAVTAFSVATAAVSLTTLSGMKDRVIAASLHGQPIGLATLTTSLGLPDAVLACISVIAAFALVWLELRHRGLSRMLATATDAEAFVLLTVLIAWFGHSYLSGGVLLGGDTGSHISRFLEVERGLEQGHLPLWTNFQYAGAPLLWFTGPFTYVVGGLVALVVHDAVLAAKVILFTLHVVSGWVYFALLRRLGVRAVSAMLVAAAFAGSFAHLHLFLYRGVIPQAFTIVCLVLLFYAADGLLRGIGTKWANMLIFSVATAILIVNHQPHALFAALYLGVFAAVALTTGFWQLRGIPNVIAAGALGVVASAIAVLPVLVEADWVMIEPDGALFRLQLPTLGRLVNLVMWRNTRTTWGIDYWAYLGLGLVMFALVGIAAMLRGRLRAGFGRIALPACACLAVCLFLYNPVVRDVIFVLFFAGLLAAVGLDAVIDRPLLAGRGLLLVTMLMLADLASTSVQPVARNDKGFMVEAGRLLQRTAPNQRVVQVRVAADGSLDADIGPGGSPISFYATVQRIAGNHNMAATRAHNFLANTAKLVESDLRDTAGLKPGTVALLGLFNVARVICSSNVANGCPASIRDSVEDAVLGRFIPVPASPVIFSRRLLVQAVWPNLEKPMLWREDYLAPGALPRIAAIDEALHEFLAIEGIDITTNTARAIAIQGSIPAVATEDATAWRPEIRGYSVTLDRVRLEVEANAPGYVQLAHPWFPSTRVTVNGSTVQPLRGAIELLVVPIGAGVSVIELQDGWTGIRRLSAAMSLLGIIAILITAGLAYSRGSPGVRSNR